MKTLNDGQLLDLAKRFPDLRHPCELCGSVLRAWYENDENGAVLITCPWWGQTSAGRQHASVVLGTPEEAQAAADQLAESAKRARSALFN